MKDLMSIILEGAEVSEYRFKFAFEPSKDQLTRIERMLNKHDLISFGPLKKTIFQSKPLDFYDLDCGEIYIIDVELQRPVSQNILLFDITSTINVSESLVRVRSSKEPLHSSYDDIELDEEYTVKLLDEEYSDAEDVDVKELMGDDLSDKVSTEALEEYRDEKPGYSEYMSAAFSKYYPKAKSDVTPDSGPTKE